MEYNPHKVQIMQYEKLQSWRFDDIEAAMYEHIINHIKCINVLLKGGEGIVLHNNVCA